MARLVFGMNQSLDGFVDHEAFAPDSVLFEHFIRQTRNLAGSLYGRRLYEIMSYWDEEQPDWSPAEREFARVWRDVPKWVVSTTLSSAGPNATLISSDVESAVRELKDSVQGEIEVGGTVLARSLREYGLIDEYRIYLQPFVLGSGTPFFAGSRPRIKLASHERIGEQTVRLSYVPDTEST